MTTAAEPPAPFGHAGPVTDMTLARLELAAGPWGTGPVEAVWFADRRRVEAICGLYVIADDHGRLVYLGQAGRNDEVAGRLCAHATCPLKRSVFARVWVLPVDPAIPRRAFDAAEGKAADQLGVRGRLVTPSGRARRWPRATDWPRHMRRDLAPSPG